MAVPKRRDLAKRHRKWPKSEKKEQTDTTISTEEHKKRMDMLKEIGLIKDD